MKLVRIAGAHSYIGSSLRAYLEQFPEAYTVDTIATRGLKPSPAHFEGADVVFCAAGIAHVKETSENRHLYYEVNRDLVVEMAKAAKAAGVKQFILLSTMSAYGLTTGHITKETAPHPVNAYGESKLQADEAIQKLADEHFQFACLRPPMVYGKNCTGNYGRLRSFALKSPIFPDYPNQRSMIYIGNLCQFVKELIDAERGGLFFPQNAEYTSTSQMVRQIAQEHQRKIVLTKAFNWCLKRMPVAVVKKVFGNLTYERVDTVEKFSLRESIALTERVD